MNTGAALSVDEIPESEFLTRLRESLQRYLASVDAWEVQYQKFYRIPSSGNSVSADLEPLHQNYLDARRALELCVPRARRLCRKYAMRDPWQAALHVTLGTQTPQLGAVTAIGKAERSLIAKCIADLEAAMSSLIETPAATSSARSPGLLQRLFDHLF